MIKNLFEEYNFFEQYPEKELHTTALLFGGVVREGLVMLVWKNYLCSTDSNIIYQIQVGFR